MKLDVAARASTRTVRDELINLNNFIGTIPSMRSINEKEVWTDKDHMLS
jgi:hypothetical protein